MADNDTTPDHDDRTMFFLNMENPEDDPDRLSVPKLLRRTADAIEDLGEVEIFDLVLHIAVTADGYVPSIAVYYDRPDPE